MAANFKVGKLDVPGSTGSQAITGLGFTPKALFFFGTLRTSDGTSVDFAINLGMATASGSNNQGSVSGSGQDAAASANTDRYSTNANCISHYGHAGALVIQAAFTSMDADGFTINWTTVSSGVDIHYLALGGSDLTNAKVVKFNKQSGTGAQAVTGVGFQPDSILFISSMVANDALGTSSAKLAMGCAVGASQWGMSVHLNNSLATMATNRRQETNMVLMDQNNSDAILSDGSFTSFDADGFTVNWTTNDTTSARIYALCLKGLQVNAGTITQPTSTGAQAVTGVGFQPAALVLASCCFASATGVQATAARWAVGATTGASEEAAIWSGSTDNVADDISDYGSWTNRSISMWTEGTPTENATADLTAFDADGFTLNWSAADATQRQVLYFALAGQPSGGGGGSVGSFAGPLPVSLTGAWGH